MESNSLIEKEFDNRVFKCFVCSECFDSFAKLTNHVRNHLEKNIFNCNQCNKSFNSIIDLAIHNQIHDEFYQCQKCKHGFTHKSDYEIHVENHKNNITYKCPVCQDEFQINALIVHMLIHHQIIHVTTDNAADNTNKSKNTNQPKITTSTQAVEPFNEKSPTPRSESQLGSLFDNDLKITIENPVNVKDEFYQANDSVINLIDNFDHQNESYSNKSENFVYQQNLVAKTEATENSKISEKLPDSQLDDLIDDELKLIFENQVKVEEKFCYEEASYFDNCKKPSKLSKENKNSSNLTISFSQTQNCPTVIHDGIVSFGTVEKSGCSEKEVITCAEEINKSLKCAEVLDQCNGIHYQNENPADEKEKLYECDHCQKTFEKKSHLRSHMEIHNINKPLRCKSQNLLKNSSKCGYSAGKPIKTSEKFHNRNDCNNPSNILSKFSIHQTTHTNEKFNECNHCEKFFTSYKSLKRHKLIHAKEKPYKCNYCDKTFTRKDCLTIHKRIHTGEKPYKCEYCGKVFNQSITLKTHRRIHTGEKPYKCDYCKKAFSTSSNLAVHRKSHTG